MTQLIGLVLSATLALAGPKQKVFIDSSSGYKFIYPAEWAVKDTKVKTVFTIPAGPDRKAASLEIMDVKFMGDRLVWQELQATTARDGGRNLDKQWEEDLLGVPLMLTKTSREATPSTLVGLLYSRQDRKFWFKLSAKPEQFEMVERAWRDALLTLTPVSGDLPKIEEPDRPDTTDPSKRRKPPKRQTTTVPLENDPDKPRPVTVFQPENKPTTPKPNRGMTLLDATAGGRDVQIILPSWVTAIPDGGQFRLTAKELAGTVSIEALSTLDSGSPESRLVVACGSTLDNFSKVLLREEPRPWKNELGAKVFSAYRRGETAEGYRAEWYATGESVDFYWLFRYVATSPEMEKADRSRITAIMKQAAVRTRP